MTTETCDQIQTECDAWLTEHDYQTMPIEEMWFLCLVDTAGIIRDEDHPLPAEHVAKIDEFIERYEAAYPAS